MTQTSLLPIPMPIPMNMRFLGAAAAGVAIELNTAGLRKECREIYPAPALLRLAHQRGIPISFGSDAHAIEEVGQGLDAAVTLAREVGYTTACRFHRRQRRLAPR